MQWGYDNRTCGIRVPYPNPEPAALKPPARRGLQPVYRPGRHPGLRLPGLTEKCQPSDANRRRHGLPFAFARGLDEAIGLLRQCTPVASVLGERFVSAFCGERSGIREYAGDRPWSAATYCCTAPPTKPSWRCCVTFVEFCDLARGSHRLARSFAEFCDA